MLTLSSFGRRGLIAGAVVTAGAVAGFVGLAIAADHRDSAALTSSPGQDVADVYVFQSPANGNNLVLAMTVSGLIPPAETGTTFFDPNVLYQIKIDNDGDAVENLVIQAFVTGSGSNQVMHFRGPVAPTSTGMFNRVLEGPETATVRVSNGPTPVIKTRQGMTVFAGVRDDPFFFDLGQFNQIIAGQAASFNNPGTDAFAGANALAIVVELPTAMLGTNPNLGVWGTTSLLQN